MGIASSTGNLKGLASHAPEREMVDSREWRNSPSTSIQNIVEFLVSINS